MKQHKTFLNLIDWNDAFDENNESSELLKDSEILENENSNFDYLTLLSSYKNIKINLSNILKLAYNSTIT